MLSSTQTSYVQYDVTNHSTIVLPENDIAKNATSNSSLSSISMWDRHQAFRTTAERAAIVFTDPVEVLTVIVCVLGIIANVATIIAVVKMRQKMTTHLKLIISLCLSDALISLLNFSFYFTFIFFHLQHCSYSFILYLLKDIAIFATLLNLLALALDHYVAIIKPLRYRQKMTFFKGNCAVVMVWVITLLKVLSAVVFAIGQSGSICAIIGMSYDVTVVLILLIFSVLAAICLLYGKIYSHIKKAMPRRERARHHSDSGSVKALMTTGLFVGTYSLFLTPFAFYNVFIYIKDITDRMYIVLNIDEITEILNILYLIFLLNAVFDPIIYAIRLPKVKQRFKACFT
jgi:hypothetical protein